MGDMGTVSELRCAMFAGSPDPDTDQDPPECGKPARRLMRTGHVGAPEGICDECFEGLATHEDFTREECEIQHPLFVEPLVEEAQRALLELT
jgi:hypothetical protein